MKGNKQSKTDLLKIKLEALTKTMKQLIEDFIKLDSLSRGTLTAFQLHIGEKEWSKVLKQLQERELEAQKEKEEPKEKKLEI